LYKQGDTISFNAGMRTKSMIMRVEDYKKFENPEVIKINEDENKMI
jgi:prolyl-tRNA editing enzyme YbaK/EbsC (Cys-tRNA(Pro) deacylase)